MKKSVINNPKRFRDNTVSGHIKNSNGDYEDRDYEASEGLNYHKRPPKDKKKYKTMDQPGGSLRYEYVQTRPKSFGFYFEGRSQADPTRAEGVSRSAIKKRFNRVEAKLKEKLSELG